MTDQEREVLYQKAQEHLKNKDFDEACNIYRKLGNYKDCIELLEMYYEIAEDMG